MTETTNSTEPPELWWSPRFGLLFQVEPGRLGEGRFVAVNYRSGRYVTADDAALPADAVLLTPRRIGLRLAPQPRLKHTTNSTEPPDVRWSESTSTIYYQQAETAQERVIFTGLIDDDLPTDAVHLAPQDADSITIPRPHIPYGPIGVDLKRADVDALRKAAVDLAEFYRPFGSNLRATVVQLIHDAADAIDEVN